MESRKLNMILDKDASGTLQGASSQRHDFDRSRRKGT